MRMTREHVVSAAPYASVGALAVAIGGAYLSGSTPVRLFVAATVGGTATLLLLARRNNRKARRIWAMLSEFTAETEAAGGFYQLTEQRRAYWTDRFEARLGRPPGDAP